MTIAEHLKAAIKSRKLVYAVIEGQTGIGAAQLTAIISGKRMPARRELEKLCQVLALEFEPLDAKRIKAESYSASPWRHNADIF
jgi:transcriptional regulator with XRE-family HTH domain